MIRSSRGLDPVFLFSEMSNEPFSYRQPDSLYQPVQKAIDTNYWLTTLPYDSWLPWLMHSSFSSQISPNPKTLASRHGTFPTRIKSAGSVAGSWLPHKPSRRDHQTLPRPPPSASVISPMQPICWTMFMIPSLWTIRTLSPPPKKQPPNEKHCLSILVIKYSAPNALEACPVLEPTSCVCWGSWGKRRVWSSVK